MATQFGTALILFFIEIQIVYTYFSLLLSPLPPLESKVMITLEAPS